MLSLLEELMLLILDDENGSFAPVPEYALDYAIAGSVLIELALENRIDTDLESLFIVNEAPIGNPLLDPTLVRIVQHPETNGIKYWVRKISADSVDLKELALKNLVERGVLKEVDRRFFWLLQERRYPIIDNKYEREVKLRIMSVLFDDGIPDVRDIAIISLAYACGVFGNLLSARELKNALPRVRQIRKMDLIGRGVTGAVRDIEATITLSMRGMM